MSLSQHSVTELAGSATELEQSVTELAWSVTQSQIHPSREVSHWLVWQVQFLVMKCSPLKYNHAYKMVCSYCHQVHTIPTSHSAKKTVNLLSQEVVVKCMNAAVRLAAAVRQDAVELTWPRMYYCCALLRTADRAALHNTAHHSHCTSLPLHCTSLPLHNTALHSHCTHCTTLGLKQSILTVQSSTPQTVIK